MAGEEPRPLQLISLDERCVQVNEDALGRLEKRMKQLGNKKIAIVSVMGAFRTGKSFVLNLFLRYLRYEESCRKEGKEPEKFSAPERGQGDFTLPEWLTSGGDTVEGVGNCEGGFKFAGGMDAVTTGIWIWSEPFIRTMNGEEVALLLMDTQGAFDSDMTKEQSATIFGLTTVLSSKQIYNVSMQIQEDKVESLAMFIQIAKAALAKAEQEGSNSKPEGKPFQSLDFLVRDWGNFKKTMTVKDCRTQMAEHVARHIDPDRVKENSTAKDMQMMFDNIGCFCLPHPGLAIRDEDWDGAYKDLEKDFLRFLDIYVREVFQINLSPKQIMGSDLSTVSFPIVLRSFVKAFEESAGMAKTFTEAMSTCTSLLAREQAMKYYQKLMDEDSSRHPAGVAPEEFEVLDESIRKQVKKEYDKMTIFGSDDKRDETWAQISESVSRLFEQYAKENQERLEKALVGFANLAMLGGSLFLLDRVSDWTCDWWSNTCTELSKVMLIAYVAIFGYIGVYVYLLVKKQGKYAAGMAGAELWKEIMRLFQVYGELLQHLQFSEILPLIKKVCQGEPLMVALKDARSSSDTQATKKKD